MSTTSMHRYHKFILPLGLLFSSILLLCLPVIFGSPYDVEAKDKSPWLDFIGSFHPLFLHLPIGFILLIFTLEIWNMVQKDSTFSMVLPLVLNALAAVAAAVFGFVWYQTGEWRGETIDAHLWQGLIFAAISIWLPWFYVVLKQRAVAIYYVVLVGTIGLMSSAAHEGGKMSHGDPFEKAPWNLAKDADDESVSDPLVYQEVVMPILENKCYSCHGPKKQKSGFRIDSIAAMLEGGDDDISLVKGDAEKSPLIQSIHAPLEDDFHMPPKEKPQITQEELVILEWWVNKGAPEGKRLSELDPPAEIVNYLGGAGTDSAPEPRANEVLAGKVDLRDDPLNQEMSNFLESYPDTLKWVSDSVGMLRFSASSLRKAYGNKDLEKLRPFREKLIEINLNGTSITDAAVKFIRSCPNMEIVKLGQTQITDRGLVELAGHSHIRHLVLFSTAVTDDGLTALSSMDQLQKIYLWNTKVTSDAAQAFAMQHPDCTVNIGEVVSTGSFEEYSTLYTGEMSLKLSSRWSTNTRGKEKLFLQGNYSGADSYNIHTGKDKNAWVEIDLKKPQKLAGLIIHNRTNLPERASHIAVEVSQIKGRWQSIYESDGTVQLNWKIKTNAEARYIRIKINKKTPEYLHLRNIEIYVQN